MKVGTVWCPRDLRIVIRNVHVFQSEVLCGQLLSWLLTFVVCLAGRAVVATGGHPGRGVFCEEERR